MHSAATPVDLFPMPTPSAPTSAMARAMVRQASPWSQLTRDMSRQPPLEIGAHEGIVVEMRIGRTDAVNLFLLPRPQRFLGIETPDAGQQPLPAQDFMATSDHAVEVVG